MNNLFWFIVFLLFALAGFQFSQGAIVAGVANIVIAIAIYGIRKSYK
jgi:hypothetical protein